MNLIYIADAEEMADPDVGLNDNAATRDGPNFTIPGQHDQIRSAKAPQATVPIRDAGGLGVGVGITGLLLVAPLISLPLGLLIGAASSSPVISQMLTSDQKSPTDRLKENEARLMEKFLQDHGVTQKMAERRGYRFPPGHPQVGQSYKLHPLSSLLASGKGGVYIPQNRYDELLLEEREAELLRLLVELGATKITITEKHSQNATSDSSGSVGGGSKIAGQAKLEVAISSVNSHEDQDSRNFELIGRPWQRGSKLVRDTFAWVAFEPSWGALITAREIGECTKAAIEIKEETSFASEKKLSLAVESKLYSANAAARLASTSNSAKIYYISAEFAPFTA
jgi:hypothetical protein